MPPSAHAFLGNKEVGHTFRFNPDSAQWGYQDNVQSIDTIGGRVVQLLSVQVTALAVTGRAGSRGELQRLATNIREIMNYHIRSQNPVQFRVPSRNWNFLVYVAAMPQAGWEVASTSYPYQLQLMIEEDLTGVKTRQLETKALGRLADGIGYNPALHGGNTSAFTELVDSVLKLSPQTFSASAGASGNVPEGSIGGDEVGQAVIAAAKTQLGLPYIFGSENPAGPEGGAGGSFDCSGLTEWAYAEAGVTSLVHSAQSQYDYCRSNGFFISDPNNLQPGDLMFYHYVCSRGYICHVGLFYSGRGLGGQTLHAHSSSSPIEITGIDSNAFVGGGRPRASRKH